MKPNCKQRVYPPGMMVHSVQCQRTATKDGYCWQHHPDEVERREAASQRRYDERKQQSPWVKLADAYARIEKLEAKVEELTKTINQPKK